jgi:hypothetical protein
MKVIRGVALVAAAAWVLAAGAEAGAGYIDLIGYPELKAELGGVPTGAGVQVTQVEAADGSGNYMPNTTISDFSGKTITDKTGTSPGTLGHAMWVGRNFYGNKTSVAKGITDIWMYSANDFLGSGFLNSGVMPKVEPAWCTRRVANHSWAGSGQGGYANADVLRRLDFVVETDDYIQVTAANNGTTNMPMLADSFNAIVVGRTDGDHATGTTAVDSVYVTGRTKPDLVAPGWDPPDTEVKTSWAAPMVSACAALLVETGHTPTGLSNGSYTSPRTGLTIYHAETSEVIKAALMAGADRVTSNGRGAEITDYTVDTTNGLDSRFGAGQVNIYNSYHILKGGERDSAQDGGAASIGRYGFDYDSAFGGSSGSNSTGSYTFTADFSKWMEVLFASLVWNVDISEKGADPVGTATLYDLDLMLYDTTIETLVASSTSTLDNTENIWFDLVGGNSYRLDVVRGSGQGDFLWDYGLAWRVVPEPATVALLGIGGVALLLRRRRR